jgi:hypothetical protein
MQPSLKSEAISTRGQQRPDEFNGAGQAPGLEIWRIEKLSAIRFPAAEYGKFYSGDSFLVLKTNKKPTSPALSWDLHFWIGNSSSPDEQVRGNYVIFKLSRSTSSRFQFYLYT